jgi:tRNA 5-methylaminomethyl-2-thiouridine biosynthesis bifunctional protein
VFVGGNRLPERFAEREEFHIFETGFGTGLNFLAAWRAARGRSLTLRYTGIEKHPLSRAQIREALSGREELAPLLSRLPDYYPDDPTGERRADLADGTLSLRLRLLFADVADLAELAPPSPAVDAWFLDGFAPAKNPDMWSDALFRYMRRHSAKGATFATFTAAGGVRRGLESHGFAVERRKGFGRKRHMTAGGLVRFSEK